MDQQLRIEQNRAQTRALVKRRLLQSHHLHKEVAQKRIFKRKVRRALRNAILAALMAALVIWAAVAFFGVRISMETQTPAQAPAPASGPQVPAPALPAPVPQDVLSGTDLPAQGLSAPDAPAMQPELRFESALTLPQAPLSVQPSSTPTSTLEKP